MGAPFLLLRPEVLGTGWIVFLAFPDETFEHFFAEVGHLFTTVVDFFVLNLVFGQFLVFFSQAQLWMPLLLICH